MYKMNVLQNGSVFCFVLLEPGLLKCHQVYGLGCAWIRIHVQYSKLLDPDSHLDASKPGSYKLHLNFRTKPFRMSFKMIHLASSEYVLIRRTGPPFFPLDPDPLSMNADPQPGYC
jgi:hypothetical protein